METGTVLAVRVFTLIHEFIHVSNWGNLYGSSGTSIHVFIHVSNWGNWYGSRGTSSHASSRVHSRVSLGKLVRF